MVRIIWYVLPSDQTFSTIDELHATEEKVLGDA